jgi:integrase
LEGEERRTLLYLGWPDTRANRKKAELLAKQIEEVTYRKPYLTRSTFVSHCLQARMPPAVVAEITGHDVKTLYRDYAGCIVARPEIPDLYQ